MKRMHTIIMLLLLLAGAAVAQQASDYVPQIRVVEPGILTTHYLSARTLSQAVEMTVYDSDPDGETGRAASWRFLLREAVTEVNGSIVTIDDRYLYEQYGAELVSFDAVGWTSWSTLSDANRQFQLRFDQDVGKTFLFAMQVMDEDGLVSTNLEYGVTVHNFTVVADVAPVLTVRERSLGEADYYQTGTIHRTDVASGQELSFQWLGHAEGYGGSIASYRWGWDLADVNDSDDPGWAGPAGLGEENLSTGPIAFDSGLHTLTVDCRDLAGNLTRGTWEVAVVPVPEWSDRLPLLLVDDVQDHVSSLWPDAGGGIAYNQDTYRDAFWNDVLAPVSGWSGDDAVDMENVLELTLRDAVNYQVLLWTTSKHVESAITRQFSGRDRYVWLTDYVESVGNVFLAGSGSLMNFSPSQDGATGLTWLMPLIYDSVESPRYCSGQSPLAMSFGAAYDMDGNLQALGPRQYGYRAAGMSLVNQIVPQSFWLSATACGDGGYHTKVRCTGTKAVVLDDAFAAAHGTAGALQDTVYIWDEIDWADAVDGIPDLLQAYSFGSSDEIYDFNATSRPSPWSPQELDDGTPVLEPMWRVHARYDWIRDSHHAAGDADWPGDMDLNSVCGVWGVDPVTGTTRNEGAPIGVLSHKHAAAKPSQRADVYWGFDPYRMDHDAMRGAVRWVLADHFGLNLDR